MQMTNSEMIIELVAKFKITAFTANHVINALQQNDDLPEAAYEIFFEHYCNSGEMPYGTAKARDGDPYEWINETLCNELGIE